MKFAATGRAVELVSIKQSGIELRCKVKVRTWIGGVQYQRRHQYTTSKHGIWRG